MHLMQNKTKNNKKQQQLKSYQLDDPQSSHGARQVLSSKGPKSLMVAWGIEQRPQKGQASEIGYTSPEEQSLYTCPNQV